MSALILSGKEPADAILESLKDDVRALNPKLVIVQVGSNAESNVYIGKKIDACNRIGMRCDHLKLDEQIEFNELIAEIVRLNNDVDVSGYIVQLPLPASMKDKFPDVLNEMDPMKDVDGFTAENTEAAIRNPSSEVLAPATPIGVIELLAFYKIEVKNKLVVVVGQGFITGKPLTAMLRQMGAEVIPVDEFTNDVPSVTKRADILVSAVGKPRLITSDMVKPGAVVIDVGVKRIGDETKGDVDFDAVKDVASAITPVPGGVGNMTVACLLRNTVTAKKRQLLREKAGH